MVKIGRGLKLCSFITREKIYLSDLYLPSIILVEFPFILSFLDRLLGGDFFYLERGIIHGPRILFGDSRQAEPAGKEFHDYGQPNSQNGKGNDDLDQGESSARFRTHFPFMIHFDFQWFGFIQIPPLEKGVRGIS